MCVYVQFIEFMVIFARNQHFKFLFKSKSVFRAFKKIQIINITHIPFSILLCVFRFIICPTQQSQIHEHFVLTHNISFFSSSSSFNGIFFFLFSYSFSIFSNALHQIKLNMKISFVYTVKPTIS